MKRYALSLIIALGCLSAQAVRVVQHVYMKDGSVLSGYIQQQNFDGTITVATDRAIVYLNSNKATINSEQAYEERALDKAWIEWAEKNDEFTGAKGNRTLMLANVSVSDGKSVSKVKILERGMTVKYLELTPNSYTVKWSDVKSVRGEKRAKNALSGINREYQLKKGGQYSGQYAEETDSTLSLYLDNGVVQSFSINDVIKYTFTPINPNQDIFEQSPLLDIVKQKNGAEITGIVIEQNYSSNKDTENYILVRQKSGAIQSIKIADIKELRKEDNDDYKPLFDILLNEGDVVVNRGEVEYVNVTEQKDLLVLDSVSGKVVVDKGKGNATHITVEYRNSASVNAEMFQLVKVTETTVKKKTVYCFSYKDLVNSIYRATSVQTSVNGTTKAEYIVGGDGVFALYDAKKKRAITITVK